MPRHDQSATGRPAVTPTRTRSVPPQARRGQHELHIAIVAPTVRDRGSWAKASAGPALLDVCTDAGLRCTEVLVESPQSLAGLEAPNVLALCIAGRFLRTLEDRSIAFLGSTAQVRAMTSRSKIAMKTVLEQHGLPTPRWKQVGRHTAPSAMSDLRFPLMVKPDDGAKSVGVVRVDDFGELQATCVGRSGPMIAEEWRRSREFSVAVIGNGRRRRAFGLEVVVSKEDLFLTADVKRHRMLGTTAPVLDAAMAERLEHLAIAVAGVYDLTDFCRIDILEEAEGQLYVIDVNSLPGLRPGGESHYPLCLGYGYGATYADLVLALVGVALLRHRMALPRVVSRAHSRMLEGSG